MNDRSLSTLAIFGFVILGTICLGLRHRSIERDEAAREDSLWALNYDARFEALDVKGDQETQVRFAIPFDTRYAKVERGDSIASSPKLTADVKKPDAATGNRMLVFSTRQPAPAPYDAHAKFVLRLSSRPSEDRSHLESLGSSERFLRPELDLPTTDPSVRQIAQLLPSDLATKIDELEWIFKYCSEIDSGGSAQPSDDAQVALTTKHGSPKAQARAMVTLCRALGFPSRLVTGFIVRQGENLQPHVWVEVFYDQQWVFYDPTSAKSLTLPPDYVPIRRDSSQIFNSRNVKGLAVTFSIKRLPPDTRLAQAEKHHPLQILNLTRLPLKMHKVMKILLLLPFAALITTIIRNVVGVGTFGTFSPALLAMSFIYADWKTGLAILLIVIMIGLVGRASLERLRLLTVPRLSIILTGVILCVVFGVSTLHYMVSSVNAEVVLLPMVILTNLIERFHVSADEDGVLFTVKLAVGTLFVALLCYLVLVADRVGDFVLTYPEAHFFTIAVFIMLGRYAGYRLTELWRFRDLVESGEAVR